MPLPDTENVLDALTSMQHAGDGACLATLIWTDGSSPRPLGSQMAIGADGRYVGYLTGGCAEQAIADEGVRAIESGAKSAVRFGVGSPYLDIQLPCGAGIDVFFDPLIDAETIAGATARLRSRRRVAIDFSTLDEPARLVDADSEARDAQAFRRWYEPPRRLAIVGTGPIVPLLAGGAAATGETVRVWSPDEATLAGCRQQDIAAELLTDDTLLDDEPGDRWTAFVVLFHEHEREPPLLSRFLGTEAYYIGALGSPRTHAARLAHLRASGYSARDLERIHGPVGLDIGARTPGEIAVAILGQMTGIRRAEPAPLLVWTGGSLTAGD